MSSLELEYELQNKITSAALRLANDMSADRSLRRQRKLCYQQANEKLKQVEQKLGTLKKQKNHGNKPKIVHQSDDEPSEDNISHSTVGSDTPFKGSSNASDVSPAASPKLSSYDGLLVEKRGRLATISAVPGDVRLSPSLASVSAPASPIKHRAIPGRTASPGAGWTGYGAGYAPSNVYQTRTAYRRQQYPTLPGSGSEGSSPVPLKSPYRDRFESGLNVDGSNLYSVPTQRTSQAFDSQDDLVTGSPGEPQDLGLVSRHNSLESNRRHHRRIAGTSAQSALTIKWDSAVSSKPAPPVWAGPSYSPPTCAPVQCVPVQSTPPQCTTTYCPPTHRAPMHCPQAQCTPPHSPQAQCTPMHSPQAHCTPMHTSQAQCAPMQCPPMQCPPMQCSPMQCSPMQCPPAQCPSMQRIDSHPRLPPHLQQQHHSASPSQQRRAVPSSLSYPENFPPPSSPVVSGNHYHPSKSHSYHENMMRHIDESGVPVFVPVDSDGSLRYQDAVHRPVEPFTVYHKPPMPPALIQHHLAHRKKLQEVCGDSFPSRPLSSMSTANYATYQRVHPDPYLSQPASPTGYSAAHSAKLETLQEGHSGSYGNQCLSVTVSSSRAFSSVTQSYSTESLKHRAKDWVETSLDSPLPARKPSKQQEPLPASPSRVSVLSSGSESVLEAVQGAAATLSRRDSCREGRAAAAAAESPHFERDKICSPLPQPLSPKTIPGVELNIVTLGHFQPYWEETKPYEISDFYKYSTKHRKPSGSQDSTKSPSQSGNSSGVVSPVLMSPLTGDSASRERDEQLPPHSSLAEHMKMVERSPPDGMAAVEEPHTNRSADSSLNLDRSSVADAFHEEMIAWYEDQDSGNKATLV